MWAINIIGGSIAGLTLAKNLAEHGWEVRVIEEHETIGKPMQCSGLLSDTGIRSQRLDVDDIVKNTINGAKIYSPDNTLIKVERPYSVAYVVDRTKLDQKMAKKAEKRGAHVLTGTKLIDVNDTTLFLKKSTGRGEVVKGKYLVGADGPNSFIRKTFNYAVPKENENYVAIHGRLKGSFEKNFVELHFGSFAPNFFAWLIPDNSKEAKVGLAAPIGTDLSKALSEFLASKKDASLDDVDQLGGGMIPVGPPLKHVSKGNTLLLGDAAWQTKATTGGGMIYGSHAASLAADVIEKHHVGQSKNFKEYDALCQKQLNPDLNLHWKITKYFRSLREDELNSLFNKAKHAGIEEFLAKNGDMDKPTKFVPKLKPLKFIKLAPELLKFSLA